MPSVRLGGPDIAPQAPRTSVAPRRSRGAPLSRLRPGGPDMAASTELGGPDMAPQAPRAFVAARRSRGAPLSCLRPGGPDMAASTELGAPIWPPKPPERSSRRGGAVALLYHACGRGTPTWPHPLSWGAPICPPQPPERSSRPGAAGARAGGVRGPLHGVPIGIKDIFDVAGMPTTAGAREFAHTRPSKDSTAVARLRAAGAVILGKTHTTQFAFRDPAPTRNPWNRQHTPGGSSSGSAAAVAARMVPAAIGSQTVGSILRPAAFCGVVGLKGPYGLVPLDGVVPLAWSFDHAGPFARSVADAAVVLSVMADVAIEPLAVEAPRLAIGRQLFDRAEPLLRRHLEGVVERLAAAGARVTELTLPAVFGEVHAAGQVVLEVEAATYHQPIF